VSVFARGRAGVSSAAPLRAARELPAERALGQGRLRRARGRRGRGYIEPRRCVTSSFVTVPLATCFAVAVGLPASRGDLDGRVRPAGADAVVMVEYATSVAAGRAACAPSRSTAVAPGQLIRWARIFGAGAAVAVPRRRPGPRMFRCARDFWTRGERLPSGRASPCSRRALAVEPTETPRPGQGATPTVRPGAQVEAAGCLAPTEGRGPDDARRVFARRWRARSPARLRRLSGGSSVGTKDSRRGHSSASPSRRPLPRHRLRPGKPRCSRAAGRNGSVGMPGFPTSSMVVFDCLHPTHALAPRREVGRETCAARRAAKFLEGAALVVGRKKKGQKRLQNYVLGASRRDGGLWAETLAGGLRGDLERHLRLRARAPRGVGSFYYCPFSLFYVFCSTERRRAARQSCLHASLPDTA